MSSQGYRVNMYQPGVIISGPASVPTYQGTTASYIYPGSHVSNRTPGYFSYPTGYHAGRSQQASAQPAVSLSPMPVTQQYSTGYTAATPKVPPAGVVHAAFNPSSTPSSHSKAAPSNPPPASRGPIGSLSDIAPVLYRMMQSGQVKLEMKRIPAESSLEIFCGEHPSDMLRYVKEGQAPDCTLCLSYDELVRLWWSPSYATNDAASVLERLHRHNLLRQAQLFAQVLCDPDLAARTAFSIECCFATQSITDDAARTLRACVDSLLKAGANVAFADFALDVVERVLRPKVPPMFKEMHRDITGEITLRFEPDTLAKAPHGQLVAFGSLAQSGESVINTLVETHRPILHPSAAAFLRVLAVADPLTELRQSELVSVDRTTGEWTPASVAGAVGNAKRLVGVPAVLIIDPASQVYRQAGWKGHCLLFIAHFAELQEIKDLSAERLYGLVAQSEGVETALRIRTTIESTPVNQRFMTLQQTAASYITRSPQSAYASYATPHTR